MALNPFIADIGSLLPQIISGSAIVSVVMSLPTTGPMLLRALQTQDMYLAGSFLMFLALLTVIGMLVSDLAARRARPAHPLRRRPGADERPLALRLRRAVRPGTTVERLTPSRSASTPPRSGS